MVEREREAVGKFIGRLSPAPVCDDCVASRLDLSTRQKVASVIRELVGSGGFERGKESCSLCGELRMVTWRK